MEINKYSRMRNGQGITCAEFLEKNSGKAVLLDLFTSDFENKRNEYLLEHYFSEICEAITFLTTSKIIKKIKIAYSEKFEDQAEKIGNKTKIEILKKNEVSVFRALLNETLLDLESMLLIFRLLNNEKEFPKITTFVFDETKIKILEITESKRLHDVLKEENSSDNVIKHGYALIGGITGSTLANLEMDFLITKENCFLGLINIYTKPNSLIYLGREILKEIITNSCGECIPCREGFYSLKKYFDNFEIGKAKLVDIKEMNQLLMDISSYSFCDFGKKPFNILQSIFGKIQTEVDTIICQ